MHPDTAAAVLKAKKVNYSFTDTNWKDCNKIKTRPNCQIYPKLPHTILFLEFNQILFITYRSAYNCRMSSKQLGPGQTRRFVIVAVPKLDYFCLVMPICPHI